MEGDGGASSAPQFSASQNDNSQVSRGAPSPGRMMRCHLVGIWLSQFLVTVQPWFDCVSQKKLHRVRLSFPQASVRQSCPGRFAIQDINVISGNATAFSALSAFFRVYFPKDVEIYHLESMVQKARDLLLRNQETLTFETCLKSIYHTEMRQMSPASAPGVYWASMWSQRWGHNSAQRGYFRFGAEIRCLLL